MDVEHAVLLPLVDFCMYEQISLFLWHVGVVERVLLPALIDYAVMTSQCTDLLMASFYVVSLIVVYI
jgi:hypothetical protein